MMHAADDCFSGSLRGLRLPNSLSEKAGTPLTVFLPCAVWRVLKKNMLNRRMEHACELLSAPDAQVKDIAGLVGYSNISHFSDAFRKKFGCTPSEYKRSLPF